MEKEKLTFGDFIKAFKPFYKNAPNFVFDLGSAIYGNQNWCFNLKSSTIEAWLKNRNMGYKILLNVSEMKNCENFCKFIKNRINSGWKQIQENFKNYEKCEVDCETEDENDFYVSLLKQFQIIVSGAYDPVLIKMLAEILVKGVDILEANKLYHRSQNMRYLRSAVCKELASGEIYNIHDEQQKEADEIPGVLPATEWVAKLSEIKRNYDNKEMNEIHEKITDWSKTAKDLDRKEINEMFDLLSVPDDSRLQLEVSWCLASGNFDDAIEACKKISSFESKKRKYYEVGKIFILKAAALIVDTHDMADEIVLDENSKRSSETALRFFGESIELAKKEESINDAFIIKVHLNMLLCYVVCGENEKIGECFKTIADMCLEVLDKQEIVAVTSDFAEIVSCVSKFTKLFIGRLINKEIQFEFRNLQEVRAFKNDLANILMIPHYCKVVGNATLEKYNGLYPAEHYKIMSLKEHLCIIESIESIIKSAFEHY